MAFTYQTTDLIGSGPQFTFAGTGDELVVAQGTTIGSTDQVGVIADTNVSEIALLNFGTIFSQFNAVVIRADDSHLTNGVSGVISSTPNSQPQFTVSVSGDNVTTNNLGEINHLGTGWSIAISGATNAVTNAGTISSTGGGVWIGYLGGTGSLVNTGVIAAGSNGTFGGAVQSAGVGISTANASVVNSGMITATIAGAIVLEDEAGGANVVNHGYLLSALSHGIDLSGVDASVAPQQISITNTGTITGALKAIQGGDGIETVTNSGSLNGGVDLGNSSDTLTNSGQINGTVALGNGADSFKTAGNGFVSDVIMGENGNDTLRGGSFDDTLDGGNNDDLLRGKNGEDDLTGGSGNDTLFGGNDDDSLMGDSGDDDLRGGSGNDTLTGGGNKDRLLGNAGDDSLDGGAGDDTLLGGSGNDTLLGQTGQDALTGDAGEDVFVFAKLNHSAVGGNRDVIRDFEKGQDKIDIEGLSNDTFVFIGNSGFSGTGGAEVRVSTNAFGNSIVRIDANGDGATDSEILVRAVTDLDAGDFIL